MTKFEAWAAIAAGDHGMGTTVSDNVGMIEVSSAGVRWVPRDGEGWHVPAEELTVLTKRTLFNRPGKGIAVSHPRLGRMRIQALAFPPGMGAHPSQQYLGQARRTGKLRSRLVAAGAAEQ